MKKPHFYKVPTHLGALYQLIRQDHDIGGVEDAPDYILTPDFLKAFPGAPVSEYDFSSPEQLTPDRYYEVLARELKELSELINQTIQPDQTQVCIGGDNTLTASSLIAVIARLGEPSKVGYIHFDSHADLHMYHTSISKNFHGMYLRPFFEQFDIPEIDALAPQKMNYSQMFTIGDIIFDEGDDDPQGERARYNQITNINQAQFQANPIEAAKQFADFTDRFKHLHISFDIDIFNDSVAGATGENEGLWFWEEVKPFLEIISRHPSFSIDLVEINPHLTEAAPRTIKVGQQVLKLVLG